MWETFSESSILAANIATAAGIIFAAYQFFRFNKQLRLESHLNLIQSEREIWTAAMNEESLAPVLAEIWGVDGRDPKEGLFWAIFLDSAEHMLLRYEAGVLAGADWTSFDNYIGRLVRSQSFAAVWAGLEGDYSSRFVRYVQGKRAVVSA